MLVSRSLQKTIMQSIFRQRYAISARGCDSMNGDVVEYSNPIKNHTYLGKMNTMDYCYVFTSLGPFSSTTENFVPCSGPTIISRKFVWLSNKALRRCRVLSQAGIRLGAEF